MLALLGCTTAVGTLIDRIDRVFYKLEAEQNLQFAAEVSSTNAAVQAVIYTPPMADVDGGVLLPDPYHLSQQRLIQRPGSFVRGMHRGHPAGGEQIQSSAGDASPLWQGALAEPSETSARGDDFLVKGVREEGSSGALVATSSAARISLGGALGYGRAAPRATRGVRFGESSVLPGSPAGLELSAAALGSDDPGSYPVSNQLLRAMHPRSHSLAGSERGKSKADRSIANSPIVPRKILGSPGRLRTAGEFPTTEGVTDASASFLGHAKVRRNSSVSSDDGGAGPSQQPYDVQHGPLMRALVKCFSVIHNWPRMVSISGERWVRISATLHMHRAPLAMPCSGRSREFAALNGMRTISMGLIILNQTFMQMVPVGFTNIAVFSPSSGGSMLASYYFQIVLSATLAVGT